MNPGFVSGFNPPTKTDIAIAVGHLSSLPAFQEGEGFFEPLETPSSIDDWLAQYKEEYQSFDQFVRECPWISSRKRRGMSGAFFASGRTLQERYPEAKLYLVQLGDFPEANSPSIPQLARFTEAFFQLPVELLPPLRLETRSKGLWLIEEGNAPYKLSMREKDTKRQLQLDILLKRLKNSVPKDALCLIALTMEDLYDEPPDLFVAGMAAGNSRVACFSFSRYDPALTFSCEHWFDQRLSIKGLSTRQRFKLIQQRSCKTVVHEIAHLLGFGHCVYYQCIMNGSGHLAEDFRQPMFLCPVDLAKMVHMCGFDVFKRYQDLKQLYEEMGMIKESRWIQRRIDYMGSLEKFSANNDTESLRNETKSSESTDASLVMTLGSDLNYSHLSNTLRGLGVENLFVAHE